LFPEYRELITKLKHTDNHFDRLFNQHNELDQEIQNMESRVSLGSEDEIETLKKQKLSLKDELYAYLQKVSAQEA
jgi:hypothetical protein